MKNFLLIAVLLLLVLWSIMYKEKRDEKKRLFISNLSVTKLDQVLSNDILSLEKWADETARHLKQRYAPFFEEKGYLLVCDFLRVLMKSGDIPTPEQVYEKDYASALCLYMARPGEKNKPIDTNRLYGNINIWEMYTSFGRKRGLMTTLSSQEIQARAERTIKRFAEVLEIKLS